MTPTTRTVGSWLLEQEIGSGSFAVVWRARHTITGEAAAVKEINTQKLNPKLQESLASEVAVLNQIRHRNIVRLLEILQDGSRMYLVLEYCTGGDLGAYIRRYGRVSEATARYFLRQLAAGLRELRRHNVIHRDLKPQNLLLSDTSARPELKIADFGFARALGPQRLAETLCGSPLYMAPEILQCQRYDAKADLWSVGTIVFELLAGRPPFSGANHVHLLRNIERSEARLPQPVAARLSDSCKHLLAGLLRRNPVERILFEELFEHPFLAAQGGDGASTDCEGVPPPVPLAPPATAPGVVVAWPSARSGGSGGGGGAAVEAAQHAARQQQQQQVTLQQQQQQAAQQQQQQQAAQQAAQQRRPAAQGWAPGQLAAGTAHAANAAASPPPAAAAPVAAAAAAAPGGAAPAGADLMDSFERDYVLVHSPLVGRASPVCSSPAASTTSTHRGGASSSGGSSLGSRAAKLLQGGFGAALPHLPRTPSAAAAAPYRMAHPAQPPPPPHQAPPPPQPSALAPRHMQPLAPPPPQQQQQVSAAAELCFGVAATHSGLAHLGCCVSRVQLLGRVLQELVAALKQPQQASAQSGAASALRPALPAPPAGHGQQQQQQRGERLALLLLGLRLLERLCVQQPDVAQQGLQQQQQQGQQQVVGLGLGVDVDAAFPAGLAQSAGLGVEEREDEGCEDELGLFPLMAEPEEGGEAGMARLLAAAPAQDVLRLTAAAEAFLQVAVEAAGAEVLGQAQEEVSGSGGGRAGPAALAGSAAHGDGGGGGGEEAAAGAWEEEEVPDGHALLYQHALLSSKAGGVEELMGNWQRCCEAYASASTLLLFLALPWPELGPAAPVLAAGEQLRVHQLYCAVSGRLAACDGAGGGACVRVGAPGVPVVVVRSRW